jgi:glyoxylase-like metal-dependent hydrolase (beta-lactamase superfamily II)/ferredoxin
VRLRTTECLAAEPPARAQSNKLGHSPRGRFGGKISIMARLADRLPENADGEFFVDSSCIDCAMCRGIAPGSFARSPQARASVVDRQPSSPAEELRAKMALVSCPTSSIGSRSKLPLAPAVDAFPELLGDDVYFCGFASERSFGARSYLIRRPEGNVLVDSPRAVPRLLERIEELGGVRWMFLTHQDDVADHAKIAKRFGCTRVIHSADVTAETRDVERTIDGEAPTRLDHDLLAVPVPGHTRGSCMLLVRDFALFTGDHLFATEGGTELRAYRSVCWYSWELQKRSLEKLLTLDFEWVLPGHEGRMRAPSREAMRERVRAAIARAQRGGP